MARFSLVKTVRLIVRVLAETAIRLGNKAIAFRLGFGFCFGMSKPDSSWGERLVTAKEAALYLPVHESTVHRWMKNGVTSFGMSLDVSVKDNHLVISLAQVQNLQEKIDPRVSDGLWRVSYSPEYNFEKTPVPPLPHPRRLKSLRHER